MKIAWKFGRLEAEIRVLKMGEILMFVFMLLIVVGVLTTGSTVSSQKQMTCMLYAYVVHVLVPVLLFERNAN
ncbi:hypothetical protein Ahy_A05g022769 isoform A [Arachis hypogaea]|uniref:Uncharacterized protein n=1 Tax=Arachis hypogaea TaxID=3818 RepID=A0A445D1H7_ARAHY|nr:hypothetical protein Ahy_A05g022769 isoform A [Arachis hypogaea]